MTTILTQGAKQGLLNNPADIREELVYISRIRTESAANVKRAQIMLAYSDGKRISEIAWELGINRPLVMRVIYKALTFELFQGSKTCRTLSAHRKLVMMQKAGYYTMY